MTSVRLIGNVIHCTWLDVMHKWPAKTLARSMYKYFFLNAGIQFVFSPLLHLQYLTLALDDMDVRWVINAAYNEAHIFTGGVAMSMIYVDIVDIKI